MVKSGIFVVEKPLEMSLDLQKFWGEKNVKISRFWGRKMGTGFRTRAPHPVKK